MFESCLGCLQSLLRPFGTSHGSSHGTSLLKNASFSECSARPTECNSLSIAIDRHEGCTKLGRQGHGEIHRPSKVIRLSKVLFLCHCLESQSTLENGYKYIVFFDGVHVPFSKVLWRVQ